MSNHQRRRTATTSNILFAYSPSDAYVNFRCDRVHYVCVASFLFTIDFYCKYCHFKEREKIMIKLNKHTDAWIFNSLAQIFSPRCLMFPSANQSDDGSRSEEKEARGRSRRWNVSERSSSCCQHFEKILIVSPEKKTIVILFHQVDTVIECLTLMRFLMTFDSKCNKKKREQIHQVTEIGQG